MKIESLKELKALLKLCREQGVEAFEVGEIKFNLGPAPIKQYYTPKKQVDLPITPGGITEDTKIATDLPDQEALLFWSTQGPQSTDENLPS